MADPVSWLVVQPGWQVVASDGTEVGRVHELIGDTGKDIFSGLSVSTGLLKRATYVPAERVASIVEGRIDLDVSADEFSRLDDYGGAPPSLEIDAG